MYCPTCGVASAAGLSYCKRCGATLNIAGDSSSPKSSQSAVSSLMDSTFWVTFFGLGVIVGGAVALKALEFREVFIIAYMILSTVAFLGIYGMHVWQFIRLTRDGKRFMNTDEAEGPNTKELDPAHARELPEFKPSVTEHTTRTFEPITAKRKTE